MHFDIPLMGHPPQHCLDLGVVRTWKKGESIIRPAHGEGMWLLESGQVRMLHHYNRSRAQANLLFVVDAPGLLFEWTHFMCLTADAEARATRTCRTVYLDRATIDRLVAEDKEFAAFLLRSVMHKATLLTRRLVWSSYEVAEDALFDILREYAETSGEPDEYGVRVKVSRTTLAQDMGTHQRTILRRLTRLEEQGRIKLWRNGATILAAESGRVSKTTQVLIRRDAGGEK